VTEECRQGGGKKPPGWGGERGPLLNGGGKVLGNKHPNEVFLGGPEPLERGRNGRVSRTTNEGIFSQKFFKNRDDAVNSNGGEKDR